MICSRTRLSVDCWLVVKKPTDRDPWALFLFFGFVVRTFLLGDLRCMVFALRKAMAPGVGFRRLWCAELSLSWCVGLLLQKCDDDCCYGAESCDGEECDQADGPFSGLFQGFSELLFSRVFAGVDGVDCG